VEERVRRADELIVEVHVPKSQLFDFGEGVYRTVRRSSVVHEVDMVVMASRRKGSTLSFTENAEAVVVLRDVRPEFCVFGGERVIVEGELLFDGRNRSVSRQRAAGQTWRVLE